MVKPGKERQRRIRPAGEIGFILNSYCHETRTLVRNAPGRSIRRIHLFPCFSPGTDRTRRIWDQAPHSAFTGLIDYEGKLYCCFREAKSHVPQLTGEDGKIRILVSDTGEAWEPFALVESQGTDLRDPQLSRTPTGG